MNAVGRRRNTISPACSRHIETLGCVLRLSRRLCSKAHPHDHPPAPRTGWWAAHERVLGMCPEAALVKGGSGSFRPADAAKPTEGRAFRFWLKLGFISFGGPAGQIAIM